MKRILGMTAIALTLSQAGFSAPGLFFDVTADGYQLTISTTVPNHYYPNAGIKLNTPGYSFSGSACTLIGNGYCLFPVSNAAPRTMQISGPSGALDVLLALNGEGPLTIQHAFVRNQRFIYVINDTVVSTCWVNSRTGLMSHCTANTPTFTDARVVAVNATGSLAYVVQTTGTTYLCSINTTTGTFTSCQDSGATAGSALNGLALTATYAYFSDYTTGHITKCSIDSSTGLLSDCAVTHDFGNPTAITGVTVNPAGNMAYIPYQGSGSHVTRCSIDASSGELIGNTCVDTGATGLNEPFGVTFDATGRVAYIVNGGGGTGYVVYCNVTMSGTQKGDLSQCTTTGTAYFGIGGFGDLVINATGTLAYYPGTNTTVTKCAINSSTGALSSCSIAGSGFTADVSGLALR